VLLAAARRFLVLLGVIAIGVVAVSLLLGLALGSSAQRAVSLGFYLVGSFLLVAGFFLGNRGPTRLKGEPGAEGPWGMGTRRRVRWATADEREAAINDSAILVALGLALILVGVAADNRYSLL
jgi:hypothetical protein